jgi:hypothetical protein
MIFIMIKTLTLIVFVLAAAAAGFSQGTGYDGKPPTKEQKKLAKEADKKEKEQRKQELRDRTVDLKTVTTFPKDYVGKSMRIAAAVIEDLSPYSENGQTYYFLRISDRSDDVGTIAVPIADTLTFGTSEDIARALTEKLRFGHPVADLWFDVIKVELNGRPFFIARVACVNFWGLGGKSVGACQ